MGRGDQWGKSRVSWAVGFPSMTPDADAPIQTTQTLPDRSDRQPMGCLGDLAPNAKLGRRPRKADKRHIVEAILYQLRARSAWRLLPHDFLPWQTVYYYLRRWQAGRAWATVRHTPLMADRERAGREASPTVAIIDSQSARSADPKGDSEASTRVRKSTAASATS
jgi:transposase